jgi:hypothetical protein
VTDDDDTIIEVGDYYADPGCRFVELRTDLDCDIEMTCFDRKRNEQATWPLRTGWEWKRDQWIRQQLRKE